MPKQILYPPGKGLDFTVRSTDIKRIVDSLFLVIDENSTTIVYYNIVDRFGNVSMAKLEHKGNPIDGVLRALQSAMGFDEGSDKKNLYAVWNSLKASTRKDSRCSIEFHPKEKWWARQTPVGLTFNQYNSSIMNYDVNEDYTKLANKAFMSWFEGWLLHIYSGTETTFKINAGELANFIANPFRLTEVCQILYSPGGGRGKTTYGQLISSIIGDKLSHVESNTISKRFSKNNYVPCIKIYDDLETLKKLGALKSALSTQTVNVEVKFQNEHSHQNYGMVVITTNHPLPIADEGRRFRFCRNTHTEETHREWILQGIKMGIFEEDTTTARLTEKGIHAIVGWAQRRSVDPDFKFEEMNVERAMLASDEELWDECILGPNKDGLTDQESKIVRGEKTLHDILDNKGDKFFKVLSETLAEKVDTFKVQTFITALIEKRIVSKGIRANNLRWAIYELFRIDAKDFQCWEQKNKTMCIRHSDYENLKGQALYPHIKKVFASFGEEL